MEGPVVLQSKYGWSRMDHMIWILNMRVRLLNFFLPLRNYLKPLEVRSFHKCITHEFFQWVKKEKNQRILYFVYIANSLGIVKNEKWEMGARLTAFTTCSLQTAKNKVHNNK